MTTSPPGPPLPPFGPPRGTYFSRRKLTQPRPPSPAKTRILVSSINFMTAGNCPFAFLLLPFYYHPPTPGKKKAPKGALIITTRSSY
jgi:hypothetical protein